MMAPRNIRCALGSHNLRGKGVLITNPRLISFIKKALPHFRPQERVCTQCKQAVENIYANKLKRAAENRHRIHNKSLDVSSSTSDISTSQLINNGTAKGAQRNQNADTSTDSSDRPTTSAAAAVKQQMKRQLREIEKYKTPQERNVRLPNVQPYIRRQQYIRVDPDIMNIYLQNLTGG